MFGSQTSGKSSKYGSVEKRRYNKLINTNNNNRNDKISNLLARYYYYINISIIKPSRSDRYHRRRRRRLRSMMRVGRGRPYGRDLCRRPFGFFDGGPWIPSIGPYTNDNNIYR